MTTNKPQSPTNGEEKMRGTAEKIVALTGYGQALHVNDILPDLKDLLSASHLALLEQVIGENEGRKRYSGKHNRAHTLIQDGYCVGCRAHLTQYQMEEEFGWNSALDLINTSLKAKIEELKKTQ